MKILKFFGGAVLALIILAVIIPTDEDIDRQMEQFQADGAEYVDNIENQVAAEAEAQYGIVSRNGSPIDRCVQAGMVAAAHLQASNESAYAEWKATEERDCAAAGL